MLLGGVTKGQARDAQRPREYRPSAFNRPRRATPVVMKVLQEKATAEKASKLFGLLDRLSSARLWRLKPPLPQA